jgi:uncharacterized membrane protein
MTSKGKTPTDYARELNVLIQADPGRKMLVIQEFYARMVAADEKETADLVLTIRSMMEAGEIKNVPTWFQAAGFICGVLTLVFFMALVVGSLFGHVIPKESRFLVSIVFALGCALATTFLGGEAAASGKIPIGKENPLAISATGGIAVLVIVLVLAYQFYVK